jgi:GNAT superfamily N-acetyltransferase
MSSIEIRPAEKFPEPEFSRLARLVFADVQQPSHELEAVLRDEANRTIPHDHHHSPMFRLGAYEGDALIGWSCGWMDRGPVFHMANSGVLPTHRRQGIYGLLLASVREHASSQGAIALRSQHSVLNNPVLIAKLKAGFHVTGLSQSAQMGTLVELTLHLSPGRQDLYRARSLPYVTPEV